MPYVRYDGVLLFRCLSGSVPANTSIHFGNHIIEYHRLYFTIIDHLPEKEVWVGSTTIIYYR